MLTQVSIKISKISYFSFTFKLNEKKKVPLKKYDLGTIIMKPVDVQLGTYIEYGVKHNNKNIFVMGYTPNWSEEVFVIKWTFIIKDLNGEKIVVTLYDKEFQKTSHINKAMLYVK